MCHNLVGDIKRCSCAEYTNWILLDFIKSTDLVFSTFFFVDHVLWSDWLPAEACLFKSFDILGTDFQDASEDQSWWFSSCLSMLRYKDVIVDSNRKIKIILTWYYSNLTNHWLVIFPLLKQIGAILYWSISRESILIWIYKIQRYWFALLCRAWLKFQINLLEPTPLTILLPLESSKTRKIQLQCHSATDVQTLRKETNPASCFISHAIVFSSFFGRHSTITSLGPIWSNTVIYLCSNLDTYR